MPEKFDKFVVTYNGLAYWFRMKGQYLYRVSFEYQFHEENEKAHLTKLVCHPIAGTIIPLKQLFRKRNYFLNHPVNRDGHLRQGIDILQAWVAEHPNEEDVLLTYGRKYEG